MDLVLGGEAEKHQDKGEKWRRVSKGRGKEGETKKMYRMIRGSQ